MKKLTVLFFSILFASISVAQDKTVVTIQDGNVAVETQKEKPKKEAKKEEPKKKEAPKKEAPKKEKPKPKPKSALEIAQSNLKIRNAHYNSKLKAYESTKSSQKQIEKELEAARMDVRKAKLALLERQKEAAKKSEAKYEVVMNPVYEAMSSGMQNGFSSYMPNVQDEGGRRKFLSKNIETIFKNYMKNYSVEKVKRTKGELFFDNILIPEINERPIDLHADFINQENGTTMRAYFNVGSEFLDFSSKSDEVMAAKNILEHFSKYIYKDGLETYLESQEKALEKLNKDHASSANDIAKAKQDIAEAENKIFQSRDAMNKAENEIDKLSLAIERTRTKIASVDVE